MPWDISNDLIIQWGRKAATAWRNGVTISFPIAITTNHSIITQQTDDPFYNAYTNSQTIYTATRTSFSVKSDYVEIRGQFWFSIGF